LSLLFFVSEFLIQRDHWGDPGVDGGYYLDGFSGYGMWKYGLDLAGLG